MDQCLLVYLSNGCERLVNEYQICSVEQRGEYVLLRMADGEQIEITSPTWEQWLNDFLSRKS